MNIIKHTILLLSFFTLACQDNQVDMTTDLNTSQWNLVTGQDNGQTLQPIPDHQITLQILPNEWVGAAGINHYQMPVQTLANKEVKVTEGAITTRMAGDPQVMEMEYRYLNALKKVNKTKTADNQLILSGDKVELIFQRTPVKPLW